MPIIWQELSFRSYDAYLKSRLWWSIRQLILERDGKCCQVCSTPSKIVHHIDYTKTILLGQGDQHQLITLCRPCHDFVEQDRNLVKKKNLLSKLFTDNNTSTLDGWQIAAKTFNTDICYSSARILEKKQSSRTLEQKDNSNKKYNKKKSKKKSKKRPSDQKKERNKLIALEIANGSYIDRKVLYYNGLVKNQLTETLYAEFPFRNASIVGLLFNHPKANDQLKECLDPYVKNLITKEPKYKKRKRSKNKKSKRSKQKETTDEAWNLICILKQKNKKKIKVFGELPVWKANHKAQSFQGKSALTKYLKEAKE